jgi:hypothetical protein
MGRSSIAMPCTYLHLHWGGPVSPGTFGLIVTKCACSTFGSNDTLFPIALRKVTATPDRNVWICCPSRVEGSIVASSSGMLACSFLSPGSRESSHHLVYWQAQNRCCNADRLPQRLSSCGPCHHPAPDYFYSAAALLGGMESSSADRAVARQSLVIGPATGKSTSKCRCRHC